VPWRSIEISEEEIRAVTSALRKKARFLIDHNVDRETAPFLASKGWNAITVSAVGIEGHSDEDVLAYAHRDDRILLTHDEDFLDDRRFPPHRNPGIVVLPGGSGNSEALVRALMHMMVLVAPYRDAYRGAKIVFSADWSVQIRQRVIQSGAMETTRYRLTGNGTPQQWVDE
jgi:predicted nuclease of predicted toxin-antitoxin system